MGIPWLWKIVNFTVAGSLFCIDRPNAHVKNLYINNNDSFWHWNHIYLCKSGANILAFQNQAQDRRLFSISTPIRH